MTFPIRHDDGFRYVEFFEPWVFQCGRWTRGYEEVTRCWDGDHRRLCVRVVEVAA